MSENSQSTQSYLEDRYDEVRQYMPGLAKRLAFNYMLLFGIGGLISMVLVPALMQHIPTSTARAIGFVLTLGWLVNGWRYLENRNHATAIYALYTRYSRSRRDLEKVLKDKAKTEDVSPLVNDMDVTATAFIEAAEDAQIESYSSSS